MPPCYFLGRIPVNSENVLYRRHDIRQEMSNYDENENNDKNVRKDLEE